MVKQLPFITSRRKEKTKGKIMSEKKEQETKKIGVVGLGNMGKAIATMLSQSGYEVYGYDVADEKSLHLSKKINFVASLKEFYKEKIPVVMAVKPSYMQATVEKIPDNRLLISIAAGLSYTTLESYRKTRGPVVRAMPNTPLQIKAGATAIFAGPSCSQEDIDFAMEVFNSGGTCTLLKNEKLMHIVTAVSGSGPAYLYLLAQSMEDSAVLMGLPRDLARELVEQTLLGSATMLKKKNISPQEHIHDVTSPAGTTSVALKYLKRYGFENSVQEAVSRATARSLELGKTY